mmetsp:Transcript_5359/g.11054  ORF Transcript_5359/g.11054 Transcript_5359/m.11054 type:complete len:153 (+) Transcript_5359:223-681(+)
MYCEDPRAQSMRRSGQPSPGGAPRGGSGPVSASSLFNNGNGIGTAPSGAAGASGVPNLNIPDGPDGIFTPLSRAIGIEGRQVVIPSVLGFPEQRFPQIVGLVAVVLSVVLSWRIGIGFFALYLIYKANQAQQQQQQQQQQGQPPAHGPGPRR